MGKTSTCKIFAGDSFLFSKVLDVNESTKEKISKKANEVIIAGKSKVYSYPPFTLKNI